MAELALRVGDVKSSQKCIQDEENHPDLGHCACCHGGKLFCKQLCDAWWKQWLGQEGVGKVQGR